MSIESEIKRAITCKYDIEIKYEKYNGETSKRKVSNTTMTILKVIVILEMRKERFE